MKNRILVVDDDRDVLKTTRWMLEMEGFEVDLASDVESGMQKMHEIKPDLLLLDLRMPDKSGFQMAREIKEAEEFKDIPIIVLSGMTDEISKHIASKFNMVEFVEKPIDFDKLTFHIRDVLKIQAA